MSYLKKGTNVSKILTGEEPKMPEFILYKSIRSALKYMDDKMNNRFDEFKRIKTELEVVKECFFTIGNTPYYLYKVRCFYKVLPPSGECVCYELIEYANDSKYAKEFYE